MHPYDRCFRLVLPVAVPALLATALAVGWWTQPDRFVRGRAPRQPIPFSHALHAGTLRIHCGYCHSGAERAPLAGIPSVETCMDCHRVTRTESPAIRELARIHQAGEPLAWNRVHHLPDHVFFDHRPHVLAGIQCQTCHGEVETMQVLERRMAMCMGNCLGCHRAPGTARPASGAGGPEPRGPEHCSACHR